jgi:DNA repair ATPase RecN
MLLSKKLKMGFIGFTVLCIAALALPASAERRVQDAEIQRQVADRLGDFKSTAFKLRRQADLLQSHRNSTVSWQTHADRLTTLKDHVNQMGRSLSELEEMKPQASDSQKLAIEHARPHLVEIAQNTTRAIELLKENRGVMRFPEYGEVASDIYDHADSLHTKLDAILDFENSKARMDALELQPMSSEGS